MKTCIRHTTALTAMLTLAACGGGGEQGTVPVSSTRVVSEPAVAQSDSRVDPAPSRPQAELRNVAGPSVPGDTIRGTASSGGTAMLAGRSAGIVVDDSADSLSTYVPFTETLEPGRYRFSALYSLDCNGVPRCEAVMRIRPPASAEDFRIVNAFARSGGGAGEATGSVDRFNVARDGDAARVELSFTVGERDAGQYRIFVLPAASVDGVYDPALRGSITLADLRLDAL